VCIVDYTVAEQCRRFNFSMLFAVLFYVLSVFQRQIDN